MDDSRERETPFMTGMQKRGLRPASAFLNCQLLPVTVNQDPAIAAMLPVMSDPNGVLMRWMRPIAMHPDVVVTIPTVVAVNPHPSGVRRMFMMLNDWRWRSNADDNLSDCRPRSETES